jgi:hypothetical protein
LIPVKPDYGKPTSQDGQFRGDFPGGRRAPANTIVGDSADPGSASPPQRRVMRRGYAHIDVVTSHSSRPCTGGARQAVAIMARQYLYRPMKLAGEPASI